MRPLLAGTLSFLLPDPAEAALLAVCLRPGRAGAAWREWRRLDGELDRYRSLLPLVDEGVRRGGLEIEEATAARLAGARLHESLRLTAIREIAGEVLDRLAERGLDPLVVRDVALAETVYPDPALRHCHALELILPPNALADAVGALVTGGFLSGRRTAGGAELAHASGFSVRLGGASLPRVVPPAPEPDLAARCAPAEIAGRRARVPAPADALALVLGAAAVTAERRSLLWVCDATLAVEAVPDLDWDIVTRNAVGWGLGIPFAAMLGWLAAEMGVRVPRSAIERMAGAVLRGAAHRRALEAALACIRADGRAGIPSLLARASGWRERAIVLRWTALPSADRLRRSYPQVPSPALPFLYAARPVLAALRSVRRRSALRRSALGSRARQAGAGAARSGDRPGPAGGRPSASRRSSG